MHERANTHIHTPATFSFPASLGQASPLSGRAISSPGLSLKTVSLYPLALLTTNVPELEVRPKNSSSGAAKALGNYWKEPWPEGGQT